jgi:hypothetical protein
MGNVADDSETAVPISGHGCHLVHLVGIGVFQFFHGIVYPGGCSWLTLAAVSVKP